MAAKGGLHELQHFTLSWLCNSSEQCPRCSNTMLCLPDKVAEPGVALCSGGVHQARTAGRQGQPSTPCGTCSWCQGAGAAVLTPAFLLSNPPAPGSP